MAVKLPTPLPYDYVDELINDAVDFYSEEENGFVWHHAYLKGGYQTSNWGRSFIQLIDEPYIVEEDEEGYHTWAGGDKAWVWTAKELTEKELDYMVRGIA